MTKVHLTLAGLVLACHLALAGPVPAPDSLGLVEAGSFADPGGWLVDQHHLPELKKPMNLEAGKSTPARKQPPAFAPVEDVAGLPRVLLIGDSISIAYTLPVREILQGKANVHFKPAGSRKLAKQVAARIEAVLKNE